MVMDPAWIALAAFGGAVLGNVYKWLDSITMSLKQFLQGIITGIIAVAGYAIGYKLSDHTLNAYDLLTAVIGGWGLVMSQSIIQKSMVEWRRRKRLTCIVPKKGRKDD